jgi:hypothetical protein
MKKLAVIFILAEEEDLKKSGFLKAKFPCLTSGIEFGEDEPESRYFFTLGKVAKGAYKAMSAHKGKTMKQTIRDESLPVLT